MSPNFTSPRLRRAWWWVFSLLIAGPALALALLGLRAIRVERIEREQQLRDQQTQVARLADAAIRNTLERIAAQLDRGGDPPGDAGSSLDVPDLPVFTLDAHGVLSFPRQRIYFGEFGQQPAAVLALRNVPSSLSPLIVQAQTAEAQQLLGLAGVEGCMLRVVSKRNR